MSEKIKPSPQLLRAMADVFRDHNHSGTLHIVLEDNNFNKCNINWCRDLAQQEGDTDGIFMCDILLLFTEDELFNILCPDGF